MIQPNSSGLTIPEKLKPVETMAKARPAAPGGAALRTSMSREGAIMPPRKPAAVMIAVSAGAGQARGGGGRRQRHERDHEHEDGVDGEADRRNLAVTLGAVGEETAC